MVVQLRRLARWRPAIGFLALVCCLVAARGSWAAESPLEFDEIVVTGQRAQSPLAAVPQSVSVISASEIRHSTATTVVDLLRQEANLNLQSLFSSDKFSSIDIRGMGATAASNVLVLVDGVRLNADDLSGSDFSTLPLSQVERIEIARGGGGVRYGNGAVGGVINIVTKSAEKGARAADLIVRRAAYDTDDLRLHGRVGRGWAAMGIDISSLDTDGFRHNESSDRRDAAANLTLDPLDWLHIGLRAAHHEDRYGLPGPLPAEVLHRSIAARRQSDHPLDRGWTEDDRYGIDLRIDGGRFGELSARGSYRDRGNPFFIGFNPIGTRAEQLNRIDSYTRTLDLEHRVPWKTGDYQHEIVVGASLDDSDYLRTENGATVVGSSSRRGGSLLDRGYFAQVTLAAPLDLHFSLGWRRDLFKSTQADRSLTRNCDVVFVPKTVFIDGPGGVKIPVVVQVPIERNCVTGFQLTEARGGTTASNAFNAGATWQPLAWLTAYANVDRNFRNPNVDEFLQARTDLGAQRGHGYDVGLRLRPSAWLELSVAAFALDVHREIYYGLDPAGQTLNFNLDNTTHRLGGEFEVRAWPVDVLALRASVGYVRPRIEGGDIPLVPRVTASVGGEWSVAPWADLALSVNHVGSRGDGNDSPAQRYAELPAYTLCDLRVRLHRGRYEAFAGINNLFNEIYSTIAYSGTVYPMPERNAYAGLRVEFF